MGCIMSVQIPPLRKSRWIHRLFLSALAGQSNMEGQAVTDLTPEFKDTARFVPTRDFVRKAEDSANPGHGHHEFGNAETYFLVGDALAKSMLKLQSSPSAKP